MIPHPLNGHTHDYPFLYRQSPDMGWQYWSPSRAAWCVSKNYPKYYTTSRIGGERVVDYDVTWCEPELA